MMEKQNKIYVAGHTGMVGSAIVRKLKENGYDNITGKTLDELDLTNQQAVESFFLHEKPEYVILAAAKVGGIMANNIYRAQFIYENLMIQNNVIHQSYMNGVKKLLFLGSSCIYPKNAPQPLKEEYLLTGGLEQTNEPYAIAKIAGIKMCESYYRQYGCNFISVMPTNLYGSNDNYNLETSHVLPALIRKMHLGKCLESNNWQAIRKDLQKRPIEGLDGTASDEQILKILDKYGIKNNPPVHQLTSSPTGGHVTITLWGTGKVYREFMHVDDMAAACVFVLENIDASDLIKSSGSPLTAHSSLFTSFLNIGTGEDLTISDVALLVKETTGFKGYIKWDLSKPDGTFRKLMDVRKLSSLGFKLRYTLKSGLEMVYQSYLS